MPPSAHEVHGSCDPRFAGVEDAFRANFTERGDLGAAVAVVVGGERVIDLWGGWADEARTRLWERDTLVNVYSIGKPLAAICLLRLAERGEIDLDAPVADTWPEFAAAGKASITSRMVLSHRAGLAAIRRDLPDGAMYDWDLMAEALAGQEPWWEPGSAHGYHVMTFGFLVGEIVRRVSGERLATCFRREVARPLQADVHFGTTADDDSRTADYLLLHTPPGVGDDIPLLQARAYLNPPGIGGRGTVNTRAWRAAEMPSTSIHATARGIARIYTALACGGAVDGLRVLRPETIEQATAEASSGIDLVLGRPSRFGLGFQLTQPERPFGPNARSFGHFGAGGSVGFADPDTGLAFAYTLNSGGPGWQDPRNRALINAVYEAV